MSSAAACRSSVSSRSFSAKSANREHDWSSVLDSSPNLGLNLGEWVRGIQFAFTTGSNCEPVRKMGKKRDMCNGRSWLVWVAFEMDFKNLRGCLNIKPNTRSSSGWCPNFRINFGRIHRSSCSNWRSGLNSNAAALDVSDILYYLLGILIVT
jgi:hypothetical protein